MSGIEIAAIGADTTYASFEKELRWNQAYHHLVTGP
jgi:L-arabinose isomerase